MNPFIQRVATPYRFLLVVGCGGHFCSHNHVWVLLHHHLVWLGLQYLLLLLLLLVVLLLQQVVLLGSGDCLEL